MVVVLLGIGVSIVLGVELGDIVRRRGRGRRLVGAGVGVERGIGYRGFWIVGDYVVLYIELFAMFLLMLGRYG